MVTQAGSTGRGAWSTRREEEFFKSQHNVRISSLVSQSGVEMEIVTHPNPKDSRQKKYTGIKSSRRSTITSEDDMRISELDTDM